MLIQINISCKARLIQQGCEAMNVDIEGGKKRAALKARPLIGKRRDFTSTAWHSRAWVDSVSFLPGAVASLILFFGFDSSARTDPGCLCGIHLCTALHFDQHWNLSQAIASDFSRSNT